MRARDRSSGTLAVATAKTAERIREDIRFSPKVGRGVCNCVGPGAARRPLELRGSYNVYATRGSTIEARSLHNRFSRILIMRHTMARVAEYDSPFLTYPRKQLNN